MSSVNVKRERDYEGGDGARKSVKTEVKKEAGDDGLEEELAVLREELAKVKAELKNAESKAEALKREDNGSDKMWHFNSKKKLTVSKFKNMVLVSFREYYEKDGELRPTQKGLALSPDQFESFVATVPQIREELKKIM